MMVSISKLGIFGWWVLAGLATFGTCLLFDDCKCHAQSGHLSAEAVPLTLPVLVGNKDCPVLKLKLEWMGDAQQISLTQLQGTLDGTTAAEDVEAWSVFAGVNDDFREAQLLGKLASPGAGTSFVHTFAGAGYPLPRGVSTLWIACTLSETANIDHRVGVACNQLSLSTGETVVLDGAASQQRLGVALRRAGQEGVHTYRIPGLATSCSGTLLAVYDVRRRSGGDLPGDIDVGLSRSTDGGQSWQPMQIIMDMGADPQWQYDGIGDPAVLVDAQTGTIWVAATWSHGNRSWHGSGAGILPEETGQLMLVHSEDDGLTWSQPSNITPQIKRPQWSFVFQGPGKGITLGDGTLVFAAQYLDGEDRQRLPHSTILVSSDHGASWQIGSSAWDDTTEAQVVEIEPGVLMLNCRYNRAPARVVMTTRDLGRTWQRHPTSERALIEPQACMASLIDVGREANKDYGGLLLFSNPDSRSQRHRMTIKASPDRGMAWPNEQQLLIDEGASAGYSCMAMIDSQTIGILYEGSQAQLTFQRIALSDIVRGLGTAKPSP